MNAIISLSTGVLHTGHFGCMRASSYVLSNASRDIFCRLSIFQISQHSLHVCWCWQGSSSIDLFRPQSRMHSMVHLSKVICSVFRFSIAALIFINADPLLVKRPKISVLSSLSLSLPSDPSLTFRLSKKAKKQWWFMICLFIFF